MSKYLFKDRILTTRAFILFILVVLLSIPLAFIQKFIDERKAVYDDAINNIGNSWGNAGEIAGPYIFASYSFLDGDGIARQESVLISPDKLNAKMNMEHKIIKRSIYKAVVWTTKADMSGEFISPISEQVYDFINDKYSTPAGVSIDLLSLVVITSDNKNVTDSSAVFNDEPLNTLKGDARERLTNYMPVLRNYSNLAYTAFELPFVEHYRDHNDFRINIELKGSDYLKIAPIAAENHIEVSGSWDSPSFYGISPTNREINSDGFKSDWDINIKDAAVKNVDSAVKGALRSGFNYDHYNNGNCIYVKLFDGITHYKLILRAVKYGILFILLTIMVLYIFEIISKTAPHILQYAVIGASLVMFYLLLLSLSEHIPFIPSYLIAMAAIAFPVAVYTVFVMQNRKYGFLIFGVISGLYLVLLSIMYMENYALLTGTLILLAALYMLMFLTRNLRGDISGGEVQENQSDSTQE